MSNQDKKIQELKKEIDSYKKKAYERETVIAKLQQELTDTIQKFDEIMSQTREMMTKIISNKDIEINKRKTQESLDIRKMKDAGISPGETESSSALTPIRKPLPLRGGKRKSRRKKKKKKKKKKKSKKNR